MDSDIGIVFGKAAQVPVTSKKANRAADHIHTKPIHHSLFYTSRKITVSQYRSVIRLSTTAM